MTSEIQFLGLEWVEWVVCRQQLIQLVKLSFSKLFFVCFKLSNLLESLLFFGIISLYDYDESGYYVDTEVLIMNLKGAKFV